MAKVNADKKLLFVLLIFSTCLAAVGQLLFKYGVNGKLSLLFLLPGLAAYVMSTAIYFVVLSRTHLSWAYGLNGISYVITVFLALTFLHENIPIIRWVGVAVIAIGAALVGFS